MINVESVADAFSIHQRSKKVLFVMWRPELDEESKPKLDKYIGEFNEFLTVLLTSSGKALIDQVFWKHCSITQLRHCRQIFVECKRWV